MLGLAGSVGGLVVVIRDCMYVCDLGVKQFEYSIEALFLEYTGSNSVKLAANSFWVHFPRLGSSSCRLLLYPLGRYQGTC